MPVQKRLMPGEEHPENIRECAVCSEMLRIALGVTLVPSGHLLLEDAPNSRLVRPALGSRNRQENGIIRISAVVVIFIQPSLAQLMKNARESHDAYK